MMIAWCNTCGSQQIILSNDDLEFYCSKCGSNPEREIKELASKAARYKELYESAIEIVRRLQSEHERLITRVESALLGITDPGAPRRNGPHEARARETQWVESRTEWNVLIDPQDGKPPFSVSCKHPGESVRLIVSLVKEAYERGRDVGRTER